ncbi:hypothetical protein [Desmospora activa]|uniref:Uncharacterized protein n=1 Tax=Desmospora activa DSM 45169 TaxID=1121389 RepID=A0A2T4Z472_9BACL|nr:hypothetical protein [Desmospora activa]PTM56689.1 hypothetical protein C8J48_3014 [Desmospora activa DSM 45169]
MIIERLEEMPVTVWVGVAVVLIVIIVINIIISKKRSQEVDELQKAFGDPYDYPDEDEGKLGKRRPEKKETPSEQDPEQPEQQSTLNQRSGSAAGRRLRTAEKTQNRAPQTNTNTEEESTPRSDILQKRLQKQEQEQEQAVEETAAGKEANDEQGQAPFATTSIPSRGSRRGRKSK